MSENQMRLPPIIKDYIESMHNPRNSKNQRDTASLMLENIINECQKAVNAYKGGLKRVRWRVSFFSWSPSFLLVAKMTRRCRFLALSRQSTCRATTSLSMQLGRGMAVFGMPIVRLNGRIDLSPLRGKSEILFRTRKRSWILSNTNATGNKMSTKTNEVFRDWLVDAELYEFIPCPDITVFWTCWSYTGTSIYGFRWSLE